MRDLRRSVFLLAGLLSCLAGGGLSGGGADAGPDGQALGRTGAEVFDTHIRPILTQYCVTCHSTEKKKGDLDLEAFSTLDAVKRHPKVLQSVGEQLETHEMPPEGKPQPSPAEKERLSSWVKATLGDIARAQAGDPGPVVLRRLSNAQYTYTVRDLTGVESLEPARQFPVDGAAGEGFTNTGQALVMSPSLVTKYFDAGKEVAAHAVLLPDGIRFSASTTRRDWTEEILARIRAFYSDFTDPRGGERVNLKGVVFDTNGGGRLPVDAYLAGLLENREALLAGTTTVDTVARERGLSPKYAASLLAVLSANNPSPVLDGVRARWRAAKPGDVPALAAEIGQWQAALWRFSSVGHIGKVGGPRAWMEPVSPLVATQELRLKIPPSPGTGEVTLYLVASDAGDGSESDFVTWQQPRLVAPGRPDLLLRDARAAIILLLMPVVFILVLGLSLGEGFGQKPADGVLSYQPAYELWSDGAEKERFVYLPPETQIDTSNPDRWTFPVGTRFYKTFAVGGKRIETRLIEKVAPEPGEDVALAASLCASAEYFDRAQA